MAGTGTRVEQGWLGSGTTGASLAANTLVVWGTSGTLINCGVGGKPVGSVQEPFASGVTCDFYRKFGGAWLAYTGTVAAGDIVKAGAAGVVVSDGSSGSTTLSVNSVGVVRELNATASICFVEFV